MEILFLIVSLIIIFAAALLFLKKSSRNTMLTGSQKALAVFQILLGGCFFALCLSDVLDIKVSFSPVRLFLNIFYALTFLSLAVFALSDLQKKTEKHVQMIVCCCAVLIAAQCFFSV